VWKGDRLLILASLSHTACDASFKLMIMLCGRDELVFLRPVWSNGEYKLQLVIAGWQVQKKTIIV
jgi:hypothetical protein